MKSQTEVDKNLMVDLRAALGLKAEAGRDDIFREIQRIKQDNRDLRCEVVSCRGG